MAAMLTTLLFVLAVSGGAFADRVEDCPSACGRTRECFALGSLPRAKVQRCLKFLYSQCENSNVFFQCLDRYISTRTSGCTGNIVRNAIPCLKCESTCEELKYQGTPTPPPTPVVDNSAEEKRCYETCEEKRCYETCDRTRECFVFYSAKPKQKKRCEKFTESKCGRNMHPIECFERLKNKANPGCPKSYRRDGLTCLKCGDNCARQFYVEKENESDNNRCNDECSKTQSCIVLDSATEQKIVDCRKMADGMCSKETHPIACLESLKRVRSETCPKAFRVHLISCMKCDMNCSGGSGAPSGGQPQGTFPENEGEKCMATCECMATCDSTAACRAVDSAAEAKIEACDKYLNSMCDEEEEGTACLDKLNATASNACRLQLRKNMADCLKCGNKCDEVHGMGLKLWRDVEICLEACSNISSCTVMENSSDEALDACENLFERQCANNDDIISCMESYTTEDASCPIMFRSKMTDCMKCERRCEQGEMESSSLSPPIASSESTTASSVEMPPPKASPMTKKRCEKSCDNSLGCGNQVRPECAECTKARCGANDFSCFVAAIAVDCRTQCTVGNENANKELCGTCKASCSIYPWYVFIGIKRTSNPSLDEI